MNKTIKQLFRDFRTQHPVKQIGDLTAILIILAGVAVSVYMNAVGRSLWVDEAMLAYSFSKRDIFHLTSGVFEWEQSAPVIYLYITKLCTLVFGNTEAVLRSVSVFSYALMLVLTIVLCHRVFRIRYGLQAAAFLANMNFMLQYSNMFKQYMSECIWVLLVFLIYWYYARGKARWYHIMAAFMVFIWGANPACFFIGGVLLYEFLEGMIIRDRKKSLNAIKIGCGVAISFLAYYFYWLRDVALSSQMQSYWQGADFPLIPRSFADIQMARAMVYEIFVTFREGRLLVLSLVVAGLLIGIIWEKDRYVTVALSGFMIALFASYIHMFPIADRLWCFSFPIFTIIAFIAIDRMGQGSTRAVVGALALICALILTNNGIGVYRRADNIYMSGEEANIPIEYIRNNIQDGEYVYVYHSSVPVTGYKLGYDTKSIGPSGAENIIWAVDTPNKDEEKDNISRVISMDGCYILASHTTDERFGPLYDECRNNGYLMTVIDEYETPLYYYSKSLDGVKAKVSYELIDREDEDGICYATIRVTNTGSCIINAEGDNVSIGSRDREEVGTNLWGNLMPGDHFDMPLQFEWGDDKAVKLQLKQGESFWYDEIGCEPVIIEK